MEVLESRIDAIFKGLDAAYSGGVHLSSASKGAERELFVSHVLKTVFPSHFRFSSGDVIDSRRNQTGQVDVVLEHARGFSFPVTDLGPRLLLAENVAAIIEVKSNLSNQWDEVIDTAKKVSSIRRRYAGENFSELLEQAESGEIAMPTGDDRNIIISDLRKRSKDPKNNGEPRIRFFVVGFKGWKTDKTIVDKLVPDVVDGIFQLDDRKFVTKLGRADGREVINGTGSMLAFLHWLELSFFDTAERFPAYSEYEQRFR